MEENLVITQPKPDPRATGKVVCRYCNRTFKSLASLRPHLRACTSRWFDREIVLDGRHFNFKANHRRKEEKALREFAQQVVKSVRTAEERHRSLSSALVLMQMQGLIKDLAVEMVGQTPAQEKAPAASPGTPPAPVAVAPAPATGTFLGLAVGGARAPAQAPVQDQDEAPVTAAELEWGRAMERVGKITPIVRDVLAGTTSPSVFRRYLKRMGCPLPPG